MNFRWNLWNIEHIEAHGIRPVDAEEVVIGAKRPYPRRRADDKWLVWGRTRTGRLLQVVFIIDEESALFVIHARELTPREKRRFKSHEK